MERAQNNAPFHRHRSSYRIDQPPLELCIGSVATLNLTRQYEAGPEDLTYASGKHMRLTKHCDTDFFADNRHGNG